MNVLVLAICIIVSFGVGALLTLWKMKTKLSRMSFDHGWQITDMGNRLNEFENALILIGKGELLKREMVVLARKALCDDRPMTNEKPPHLR